MKQCILTVLALAWAISMDAQGIIRHQTPVKPPKAKTERPAKAKAKPAPQPKKRVEPPVAPKPEPPAPVVVKSQVTRVEDPPVVEMTPTQVVEKLIADMVYIPGGTFTMYDRNFYPGRGSHCPAAYSATVSGYYLCRYEVMQQLWQAVMGSNPSQHTVGNRPVEGFYWDEAQLFIYRLNQMTGLKFRLPTEEEWQWAYDEGKSPRRYKYSGSDDVKEVGWTDWNSGHRAHSVGMLKPNALGLYDMTGNVSELCANQGGAEYLDAKRQKSYRVARGCAYNNTDLGSGERTGFYIKDDTRRPTGTGIRLALSQLPKPVSIHLDTAPQPSSRSELIAKLVNDMIQVPAGTFTMGFVFPELRQYYIPPEEMAPHQVTLDSYYLCKYEVTQALWQAVMGVNPSENQDDASQPVTNVGCSDIKLFISKLNALSGQQFRLPTEAEWEYACIGGRAEPVERYSGHEQVDGSAKVVAWWGDNLRHPQAVGQLVPNVLGLYDMTGNVDEICSDIWRTSHSKKAQVNPQGPNPSPCVSNKPDHKHVVRGGNFRHLRWYNGRGYCAQANNLTGLRLAASHIQR